MHAFCLRNAARVVMIHVLCRLFSVAAGLVLLTSSSVLFAIAVDVVFKVSRTSPSISLEGTYNKIVGCMTVGCRRFIITGSFAINFQKDDGFAHQIQ
jgi:hypothetical protein